MFDVEETMHKRREHANTRTRAALKKSSAFFAIALLAFTPYADAQPKSANTYPERPIRFLVPFATGGTADILARVLAQRFSEKLGQQVVVDNRAGSGGVLGTEIAANAPGDGYTL